MIFHHARILAIWLFGSSLQRYFILRPMADLVLLRWLIINDQARGHSDNIDRIFDRANFDILFESALVRAEIPYSPVAIALCLSLLE